MIHDDWPSAGFREADHYGRTIQRLQAEVARLTGQVRIARNALEAIRGVRGTWPTQQTNEIAREALMQMAVDLHVRERGRPLPYPLDDIDPS